MGIRLEKRFDVPQPEVRDTDYGARYVKVAMETAIEEPAVPGEESSVSGAKPQDVKVESAVTKKKSGRLRKK